MATDSATTSRLSEGGGMASTCQNKSFVEVVDALGGNEEQVRRLLQDPLLGFDAPSDPLSYRFTPEDVESLELRRRVRELPDWAQLPDSFSKSEREAMRVAFYEQLSRDIA